MGDLYRSSYLGPNLGKLEGCQGSNPAHPIPPPNPEVDGRGAFDSAFGLRLGPGKLPCPKSAGQNCPEQHAHGPRRREVERLLKKTKDPSRSIRTSTQHEPTKSTPPKSSQGQIGFSGHEKGGTAPSTTNTWQSILQIHLGPHKNATWSAFEAAIHGKVDCRGQTKLASNHQRNHVGETCRILKS